MTHLRRLRKSKGLSVKAAAKLCGMKLSQYRHIEQFDRHNIAFGVWEKTYMTLAGRR